MARMTISMVGFILLAAATAQAGLPGGGSGQLPGAGDVHCKAWLPEADGSRLGVGVRFSWVAGAAARIEIQNNLIPMSAGAFTFFTEKADPLVFIGDDMGDSESFHDGALQIGVTESGVGLLVRHPGGELVVDLRSLMAGSGVAGGTYSLDRLDDGEPVGVVCSARNLDSLLTSDLVQP